MSSVAARSFGVSASVMRAASGHSKPGGASSCRPPITEQASTNTNAFNNVTACCSAGVLTGEIDGDGDIAATEDATRFSAFVLDLQFNQGSSVCVRTRATWSARRELFSVTHSARNITGEYACSDCAA